ncbi:hypothetical protein MPNT_120072 [Candidatus Methylacidithermus pantelleriae]|uniref:Uncharacterized protein n=1 Tax=Candidatus Methylacidithermus pantelleriae TaxID=2744239 RepID=A0A8J2BJJ2_9BACT|nr:hypothetical protein MPNT_120072 [Candidatus Methylacidithermus pantelleriae]
MCLAFFKFFGFYVLFRVGSIGLGAVAKRFFKELSPSMPKEIEEQPGKTVSGVLGEKDTLLAMRGVYQDSPLTSLPAFLLVLSWH